jgi:hypothetical protein
MTPLTGEAVAALLASESPPEVAASAHPGRFAGEGSPGLVVAPAIEEGP